ncbi:hypothetical protein [Nonomuraea sp. B1E8]|uniref:hypothetical protein n=1 Tax=unclassified Nonomuraea TaxID=2593643 RepID=UPI00325CDE09
MLNLFIAVVVNAMHENEPSPAEAQTQAELQEVKQELGPVPPCGYGDHGAGR